MKILLVDDHPLFLTGLSHTLRDCTDVEAVFEVNDLDQAIEFLLEHRNIDCIFLDRQLSSGDGINLFERMAEVGIACPVAMLSADESPTTIERAMAAGAIAYIPKSFSSAELLHAVRQIRDQGSFMPQRFERALEEHRAGIVSIGQSRLKLTRRQRQVLALLVAGHGNQAIAAELRLAESTIKAHVSTLYVLLGVDNRAGCARAALSLGLVEYD